MLLWHLRERWLAHSGICAILFLAVSDLRTGFNTVDYDTASMSNEGDGPQKKKSKWLKRHQMLDEEDTITIYKSGKIGLPEKVVERHFHNREGVEFWVSEDRGTIWLEPCDSDRDDAYKLSEGANMAKLTINAGAFLDYIGLDVDEAVDLPAEWEENEGLRVEISDIDKKSENPEQTLNP